MNPIEARPSSRDVDSWLDFAGAGLDPFGLYAEAMAARLRGDTAEGDRLEQLARQADQAERDRRDLAAAIAWAPKVAKVEPADPFAKYRALVAAGEPGRITDLGIHYLPDTPAESGMHPMTPAWKHFCREKLNSLTSKERFERSWTSTKILSIPSCRMYWMRMPGREKKP